MNWKTVSNREIQDDLSFGSPDEAVAHRSFQIKVERTCRKLTLWWLNRPPRWFSSQRSSRVEKLSPACRASFPLSYWSHDLHLVSHRRRIAELQPSPEALRENCSRAACWRKKRFPAFFTFAVDVSVSGVWGASPVTSDQGSRIAYLETLLTPTRSSQSGADRCFEGSGSGCRFCFEVAPSGFVVHGAHSHISDCQVRCKPADPFIEICSQRLGLRWYVGKLGWW